MFIEGHAVVGGFKFRVFEYGVKAACVVREQDSVVGVQDVVGVKSVWSVADVGLGFALASLFGTEVFGVGDNFDWGAVMVVEVGSVV